MTKKYTISLMVSTAAELGACGGDGEGAANTSNLTLPASKPSFDLTGAVFSSQSVAERTIDCRNNRVQRFIHSKGTTMKQIIFTSLLTLGLTACTTVTKSLEDSNFSKLSGSEIQTILPGNSLRGTDSAGHYTIFYTSKNSMKIVHSGKRGVRKDIGQWRVTGDQYCRRWTRIGKGKEKCVTMYKNENSIHWVQKNQIKDRSVLLRGNPSGL